MRIGLISDTHIPEAGSELPPQVYDALAGVDLIFHAGDMHVIDVLDWLERVAPVLASRGNGDGDGYRPHFPDDDPRVKRSHIIEVEGLRIALHHAYPLPEELNPGRFEALMDEWFGGRVDVIVCGDTHVAKVIERDGVLMVNPGSATMPNNLMPQLGTVGFLTVENGQASAELVQLTPDAPAPFRPR